jgi:glutathione S-transferase
MELFYAPLACSMASRIALYEADAKVTYTYRDGKTKTLPDGTDYLSINPLGFVPSLRTDDGTIVTENVAILQYIADQYPDAHLAPKNGTPRVRLQQWLSYISSELHKAVYTPLLSAKMPKDAKTYALDIAQARLGIIDQTLTGRDFLLEEFSVADAYLFTVLHWSRATPIDLKTYPAITAYMAKLKQRPSVSRALGEELKMYAEEQERHKAA